jgi:hypothetical protein
MFLIKIYLYSSFQCLPEQKDALVTITPVPAHNTYWSSFKKKVKNLTSWVVEYHKIQSKLHPTQSRHFLKIMFFKILKGFVDIFAISQVIAVVVGCCGLNQS